MARPKKPRLYDGVLLPEFLYPDNRGRLNYWRYKKPDGTWKSFSAEVQRAVELANEANTIRDQPAILERHIPAKYSFLYYVSEYARWRVEYDPHLTTKQSWKNRLNQLQLFGATFKHISVSKITLSDLRGWWEGLTFHQQHNRRSELNRFFNYLGGRGLTPSLKSNPFTIADDKPRLVERSRPPTRRVRLSVANYWAVYREAGILGFEGLQLAMAISLLTTMRAGDVVSLTFSEHVSDVALSKTINKSEAQRGSISAAHLQWRFKDHPMLHALVKRARELSLRNLRCPFVISHTPKQKRMGTTKQHYCQVTVDLLGKQFATARKTAGIVVPANMSPPTFHEVRGLASDRYRASGLSVPEVQQMMAHTDERITREYLAGHGIEWTLIEHTLDEAGIGGSF